MDLLSEVLSHYQAQDANTGTFSLRGDWCFYAQQMEGPVVRVSTGAPYQIVLEGRSPVNVSSGDVVFLPQGDPHWIGTRLDLPAVPIGDWVAKTGMRERGERPLVLAMGESGPLTKLFTAIVSYGPRQKNTLLQSLPPLIHLTASEVSDVSSLVSTLEMLIAESVNHEPGWRISVARGVDLLLTYLVRGWLDTADAQKQQWLKGLSDARVSQAILLIHRYPERAWRLETLAAAVGLSRARFSERFHAVTGASPMAFLMRYRMEMAAHFLRHDGYRISEVANMVGYESDKSFSRAFKAWAGVVPSAYRP